MTVSTAKTVRRGSSGDLFYLAGDAPAIELDDQDVINTEADGTVFSEWFSNEDGLVDTIFSSFVATDQAGTGPTMAVKLQGANLDDKSDAIDVPDSSGNDITTGNVDISTADVTPVSGFFDTAAEGRNRFPFRFFRLAVHGTGADHAASAKVTLSFTKASPKFVRE